MIINTQRLEITPLNPRQLKLWAADISSLENELACSYQAEPLTGSFLDIVEGQVKITEKDPENYLWHSFWLLIRKNDRVVVGSFDFKDIPNSAGEVEIGYGLGKKFEHNGYMTEAVKAVCGWTLGQNNIAYIIAETERGGIASQKILMRCGFEKYKQAETIWWRL